MSSSSSNLPIGQVIGSRYRIQSLIGRGGMGMVYAATHELTARRVALKLMISHGDESPVAQERFLGEARIAAAVRHPNIVDVLDMGIYDGVPYLVMELLEGNSLDRVLESQKQLPVDKALAWLLPVMGALAFLHDADIVHRDVKPSNIFLSSLPRHPIRPKLLDFGLARTISDMRLTRSGTVIGTPLYMAPEHAAGQATGPQSDVWSIGVVLYEAIAGTSPFSYTDRSSLAAQVLAGRVRPLAERRPDLPSLLCDAVDRALQVDAARRYLDMRTFARALYLAARECSVPVPADPNPIGLPQLTNLEVGELNAAITQDLPVERGGVPAMARSGPDDIARTSRISRRQLPPEPRRMGWLLGGVMLLLLGAGVYSLRDWRLTSDDALPGAPGQPVAAPLRPAPVIIQPTVESLTTTSREQPADAAEPAPDAGSEPEVVEQAPRPRQSGSRRADTRRGNHARASEIKPGKSRGYDEPAGSSEAARPRTRPDEVESEWK